MHENQRQMQDRSGPLYDRSKARSQRATTDYGDAGRPVKVRMTNDHEGRVVYILDAPWRREGRIKEATPEEKEAWYAWRNERERLSQSKSE
jgi:hypothetical protein